MAIPLPNTTLSANDARILTALFDPETLPSSVASSKSVSPISSSLPAHPTIPQPQLSALETQQNTLVKKITSGSSTEDIRAAIKHEDRIVEEFPGYPSAYLNRAMLRRMELESLLAGETKGSIFTEAFASEKVDAIFSDISRAVSDALPTTVTSTSVSPYQARILRAAYAHRAYLYLKAAEQDVGWKGMGKAELEELASKEFERAARYGDEVAREMSVRTNPYAKMCGAIVRNALEEERRGVFG